MTKEQEAAMLAAEKALSEIESAAATFDAANPGPVADPWALWRRRNEELDQVRQRYHQKRREWIAVMPEALMDLSQKDGQGDWFSIADFTEYAKCGGFVDDDGFGQLTFGGMQTNIEVSPSDFRAEIDVSRFDGVMWYNK